MSAENTLFRSTGRKWVRLIYTRSGGLFLLCSYIGPVAIEQLNTRPAGPGDALLSPPCRSTMNRMPPRQSIATVEQGNPKEPKESPRKLASISQRLEKAAISRNLWRIVTRCYKSCQSVFSDGFEGKFSKGPDGGAFHRVPERISTGSTVTISGSTEAKWLFHRKKPSEIWRHQLWTRSSAGGRPCSLPATR